jgi:hypothetical protein
MVRRLAVEAVVDDRTARRYLAGAPVRSTSLARLERAMAELGFSPEELAVMRPRGQ